MKKSSQLFIFLLLTLIGTSCSETKKEIVISGNLKNLPDGKMVLYTRSRQTGRISLIDSVPTKKGVFAFSIDPVVYPEAIRAFLDHYENGTNAKRIFQYETNQRPNGRKISTDAFLLEDSIQINGVLNERIHRLNQVNM
jgi:hypothetical protein